MLKRHYPHGIVLEVDGRRLARTPAPHADRVPISIRLGRRRTPSALGVLERHTAPLPEDRQGIAISTFGKVIKRGWDWLGLTPATPARVGGFAHDLSSHSSAHVPGRAAARARSPVRTVVDTARPPL